MPELSTGATAGDVATAVFGGSIFDDLEYPRALASLEPLASGTSTMLWCGSGWSRRSNNRAELICDSTNTLGRHTADHWYFEVEMGGPVITSRDTGVAAATRDNNVGIGLNGWQSDTHLWYAVINGNV